MRVWAMGLLVVLGGCKSSEIIDALIVSIEVDIRFECERGTCPNQLVSTPLTSPFTSAPRGQSPAPDPRRDRSIRYVSACSPRGPAFLNYHALRHGLDGGIDEGAATFGAVVNTAVVPSQGYESVRGGWMVFDLYSIDGSGTVSQLRAPAWTDGGVSEYRLHFQKALGDGGWENDDSAPAVIETHTLTTTTEPVELQYRELCAPRYL